MPLPPYARRRFVAGVPGSLVGEAEWNETIELFLGSVCDLLSGLDVAADTMPFFTASDGAALATLTEYARTVLAAEDAPAALTLLGGLALAGGTMSGDLSTGGHKISDLAAPVSANDAVRKSYVDAIGALMSGALVFKLGWDASGGVFPGAGVAQVGWYYIVTVPGTVDGVEFSAGDQIFAAADNASTSTYADNWIRIEGAITLDEIETAIGFSFGSLAALSAVTASLISDATANGRSLITAANYSAMRTLLSLGSAALKNANTTATAGDVVQWDTGNKYPAGDGSQLTGLASGPSEATDAEMWAETSTAAMATPRRIGTAKAWIALTDATTIAVDSATGRNFKLVPMAGNRTLGFPSGTLVEGDEFQFLIKQDATGSRTLAYASGYKFDGDTAFALGTTASKYSLLSGVVLPGAAMILLQLVAVNFTGP